MIIASILYLLPESQLLFGTRYIHANNTIHFELRQGSLLSTIDTHKRVLRMRDVNLMVCMFII